MKIYRELGEKSLLNNENRKKNKLKTRKHEIGQGFFHLLDDWSKDWKNNDPEIQNEGNRSVRRKKYQYLMPFNCRMLRIA